MEGAMTLRLITYLAFLWINLTLGWSILPGSIFYRGWFLLLLGIMTTLSLVSLTTTDPGSVRSSESNQPYAGSNAASEGGNQSAQQQYFTQFCSLCNYAKPERAHHCRICNRCVLKMDHHCRWVGRCVGAGNYKSYMLTLFYVCISSGAMLYVLWGKSEGGHEDSLGWMRLMETLGFIVDWLLLASIFCSVSYLLLWHGYLVASNVTTIEYFKWKRSMRDPGQYALAPGASIRLTDYDRGLLANLHEALGHEIYLWLWPGFGEGCGNRYCVVDRGVSETGEGDGDGEGGGTIAGGWWAGAAEAKKALFSTRHLGHSGSAVNPVAVTEEGDGGAVVLAMTGMGSRASPTGSVNAH